MTPPSPLLHQLGYAPEARLVIFHADDVGMCHGSNRAFLELSAAGMLKTGSIMVPCPWAAEIMGHAAANPALDLGVHLTLTSEWSIYRWGPLTTRDPASGLLDAEGYFWPQAQAVREHLNVPAAIAELRAQLEKARAWGIDFTHIDTHMGTAMLPELIHTYAQLGLEYGVPVLLPRQMEGQQEQRAGWLELVAQLEAAGMPLVDTFRITPAYTPHDASASLAAVYEGILHALPAGVTYFSLHPNAPGEIEALEPNLAHWRTFEHEYFQSRRLRDFLAKEQIVPIGFRELRALMRRVEL